MEEKILFVLKNVLGLESATKALSQQNCDKWDSLRHLNLIVELESEFGKWTGYLNNIRACAREIVEKEIIFA